MNLLTLILNEYSEYIDNRLSKELIFFEKEGILITKKNTKYGKVIEIDFELDIKSLKNYIFNDFKIMFSNYISNAFSDIIFNDLEEKLVHKTLMNNYYYFNLAERQKIFKHLTNIQENEEFKYGEGVTYKISRKAIILQKVIDFLQENQIINLEGFVRFRLKNYMQELEDHIDKAVEDFIMEKEYNEFIKLLRYFVDIQEAKIDIVNVIMSDGGKYHIYDKMNSMINNDYLEDIATEMADKDISYDDLLISSLITLAPKQIIIHYEGKLKSREILQTIKSIFSERMFFCNGCKLCTSTQNVKQE
ncbi:MAG: putative sporulation protein YtxC [Alkaliphilus sp.]|nr:putative sporulation protein YtxC [Alkaliphilus sp.]